MYKKIVVYYMFTLLKLSEGMTEFPCQIPCPWHNKTFNYYSSSSVKGTRTWTFSADGQTTYVNDPRDNMQNTYKCHQITERFIIFRNVDTQYFRCYPIYYNPEIPLEFIMGGSFRSINQTGEFTDLCEFCKDPRYKGILSATGPPSISTLSLDCTRPSGCSPPGKVCNSSDTIPKACPTTASPTITADPKTKKSHCGKKSTLVHELRQRQKKTIVKCVTK